MAYNEYTTCTPSSSWQSMPAYIAWAVGPLTAVCLPLIVTAGWCIPFYLLAITAAGVVAGCDWWLNVRLVCLGGDRSVVGMIVSVEPSRGKTEFFGELDTDYSINLCIYPNLPGVSQSVAEASMPYGILMAETKGVKDDVGFFRGEFAPEHDLPGMPVTAVLHAEFEGAGMRDFRIGALVALGLAIAAVVACALIPPPWGYVVAAILALLAFLAGLIGYLVGDHDYTDPGDGAIPAEIHQPDNKGLGQDLLYISGRWVFDSFHEGWNEIHPVKVCTPIGTWNGAWPTDTDDRKKHADAGFDGVNDPQTKANQEDKRWRWEIHPYIDGCGDYPPLHPAGGGDPGPHIG
jgi:hypothetical protein